jgi:molecular chaperone DnaK
MSPEKSKIIGIDLGTTNSCVAVIEGGRPVVIPNSEGARTTPSIVSFDDNGGRLVGLPAKRQAVKHPERTIQSIKRFMGTNYRARIDHMEFSPEQVSACILQKLKLQAQQYLNEKVTQAIITVPAYFDDAQRLATKHAGEIAGLNVLRVINEPTASALAYGLNKLGEEANIVVFDFGGGTFDVTILQVSDGVLQVKATNGNNQLGGDDFDDRIIAHILAHTKKHYDVDLSSDLVAKQRLKEAAEKAKVELSGMEQTQISLPFIGCSNGDPINLDMTLTRQAFNIITKDLVDATAIPIESALKDARLNADQINHVVLVGGTTRIPSVQEFIRSFFNKEPNKSVNPDEAVALGAAIQGGVLCGEINDVLLLDVIPMTLGIEEAGGNFKRIVERNSTIPVQRVHSFRTTRDQQTSLHVHVLQGEKDVAAENVSLARFDIDGIPAAPAGSQTIDVIFDIDADGIFHCQVKHAGGKLEQVVLKRTTGYNQDQLEQLKKEEALRAEREQAEANRLATIVMAESTMSDAERVIGRLEPGPDMSKLRQLVDMLKDATRSGSNTEIESLRRKLEAAIGQCQRSTSQLAKPS